MIQALAAVFTFTFLEFSACDYSLTAPYDIKLLFHRSPQPPTYQASGMVCMVQSDQGSLASTLCGLPTYYSTHVFYCYITLHYVIHLGMADIVFQEVLHVSSNGRHYCCIQLGSCSVIKCTVWYHTIPEVRGHSKKNLPVCTNHIFRTAHVMLT